MNRFYLFCLSLCMSAYYNFSALAQTATGTSTISGKVVDSTNDEPIAGALISFYHIEDSTNNPLGVISEVDGSFKIRLPKRAYRMQIRSVSYLTFTKEILVQSDQDLGSMSLQVDVQLLEEVVADGKIPTVEQKGDTTSFNAKAYKTRPDADAEGLLNKMPGMEIANGTVSAQGEEVQQVLVDGKIFFGNDATLALKSLPAEVIERIEVFDQLSEQAQFTGFDDGNTKKTLNIITNSKAKNSQFGKIYGGLGYDEKYIAGGNLNIFNGDQRISLIGLSNNVNIQNFASQDLSGMTASASRGGGAGRGRPRRGGGGNGGGGGTFSANDFLVGQQNGIVQTNSFGVNFSDKWDKLDLNGSYFFNNTSNTAFSLTEQEFFVEGLTNQFYTETSDSKTEDYNHRINLRANYTINDWQSLTIRPRINFQINRQLATIAGENTLEGEMLSSTLNESETDISSYNISNDITYRLRLNKPGRTFSTSLNTGWSGIDATNQLLAITRSQQASSADTLNQFAEQNNLGFSYSANVSLTERIAKNGMLQFSYQLGNQAEDADKATFEIFSPELTLLDSALSNITATDYQTQRAGLSYRLRYEKWNASIGLDYQYAALSTATLFPKQNNLEKSFNNVLPNARVTYTINPESSLRFIYRARTRQPQAGQLQEVLVNTNPLSLSIGNNDLEQQIDHSIITRYSHTNTDKSKTFIAFLYAGISDNYIGNSTLVATGDTLINNEVLLERGGQLTRVTNFNSSYNARLFLTYGSYLPFLKSNLNFTTAANYSQTPGQVNGVSNLTQNTTFTQGLVLSSNISERVDFTIGTKGSYTFSANKIQPDLENNFYVQTADITSYYSFTKNLFWENGVSYQQYFGLGAGLDESILLWNMGLGVNLLKENRGQLKLSVFDLLNQNTSISRTITDAYVQDTETNILQQYFMLTFTYNLRKFGRLG